MFVDKNTRLKRWNNAATYVVWPEQELLHLSARCASPEMTLLLTLKSEALFKTTSTLLLISWDIIYCIYQALILS